MLTRPLYPYSLPQPYFLSHPCAQDGDVIGIFNDDGVGWRHSQGCKGCEFGAETAVAWGSCLDFELSRRPILTTCGLSVRKSRFQLQVLAEVGMPRSDSFLFSLPLWIMLEAEL